MSTPKFVLRTVVLTLAASVLVFLGVGMILADQWQIVTYRTIPAPAAPLVARIVDLDSWQQWSAVDVDLGAPTERSYEGEAGQPGQKVAWRGPMGEAQLLLTGVADDGVDYAFAFRTGPEGSRSGGRLAGTIRWRPADGEDGTVVVWTENGKLGSLMERWANWFGALQEVVKQQQGASLAGLEESVRRAVEDSGR